MNCPAACLMGAPEVASAFRAYRAHLRACPACRGLRQRFLERVGAAP